MKKIKIMLMAVPMLIGSLMVSNANAGDGRLSIGLEGASPMGDFGDGWSTGFGGSLRYEMPLSGNLALTGTAGYITFGGKDDGPAFSTIPVQLGAKYYFSEQQKGLYGHVMLGIHASTIGSYTVSGFDVESSSSTDFSYAPELGYHLANIDLGLRYQIISTEGSTTSYLGLRAAYVFGGK